MKNKKRSSKNLRINTRIVWSAVLAIMIPIIIIASFSTVFVQMFSSYLNLSSVTTNSYGIVNQVQWSQTLYSISNELSRTDNSMDDKKANIKSFVAPLEQLNSSIYIEDESGIIYSTENGEDIFKKANELVPVDKSNNLNYYGNNGLVILNHTQSNEQSYLILVVNPDYSVNDINQHLSITELRNLILSRTGLVVLTIVGLFAIAIIVVSFITTKTIVTPIKKIAKGADEIARGNLDYEIDYDSTNELGQTVNSFNEMRLRLKEYLENDRYNAQQRKILVAGIAHDLRTPLTSAKGYAEGLIDGIADTPEKQQHYLKTIRSSIDNTEKIIDDLLAYSKMDLDSYELNLTDVSVKEFFDDGSAELKARLDEAGFSFIYRCNCNEKTTLSLDVDSFVRVINNVVSNSIKYKKEDVKGEFQLSINEYERTVIIEMKDNGPGVDSQSLKHIFDIMYRADKARSKVSDGSGLGLSICRQIIELHGGSIWASSKPNNGLSIFISLPKKGDII